MPETADDLAYCHACGNPMDVTSVGPFTNVECPHCGKHTRVKREFGPYTLVRRHAIGGMSAVFIAQDNTLDREIAVKILSEAYSGDARRIAAFEHEARVTASFSHPHVVRVFTTGRAFDRFYIAMELVPGGHFEDRIKERGTIPESEMLPLAIQVAEGLKAAHAAGLIHRDIKPGNILLDAAGNARIVDFGLALLLDPAGTAKAGEIWATPYYVPPETIDGRPEDIRSDIYAFGATLYHALAGRPACSEDRMTTHLLRDAKKKIIPLQQAAPWVTPRTCAIVDRAMAYEPENRFSSYDELLSYLHDAETQLKAGAKGEVRDPAAAERRAAARRRNRIFLIAAAGVITVAAVTAGIIFAFVPKAPETAAPTQADGAVAPPAPALSTPLTDDGSSKRIAALYREAREAVNRREYVTAQRRFASLRDDPAVGEPTRSWSAVEAVLMPLLDGRPAAARAEAKHAAKHLESARPPKPNPDVAALLVPLLRGFGDSSATPPPPANPDHRANPAALLNHMAAGLKLWEQGRTAEALPYFEAVAAARPAAQDEWLRSYQNLAADYLADAKLLANPAFGQRPTDTTASRRALDAIDALIPKLKTRGRAPFNAQSWRSDLGKINQRLHHTPTPSPAAPDRATIMATLGKDVAKRDFSAAVSYLNSLPGDPPAAATSALKTLATSAGAFMDGLRADLDKAGVTGIAIDGKFVSDEPFDHVFLTGQPPQLRVSAGGKSRDCTWADISPETTLDLYKAIIGEEADPARKYARHQDAVAFQWLAGDRAKAVEAANALATVSDTFAKWWDGIKGNLPEP